MLSAEEMVDQVIADPEPGALGDGASKAATEEVVQSTSAALLLISLLGLLVLGLGLVGRLLGLEGRLLGLVGHKTVDGL